RRTGQSRSVESYLIPHQYRLFSIQEFRRTQPNFLNVLGLALPDYQSAPFLRSKFPKIFSITLSVPPNLFPPKIKIAFWKPTFRTAVTVPKAPMHKNNRTARSEYEIGLPRKSMTMQTK